MILSLRQYVIIFTLVIISLASILTYQINSNLADTRSAINASNQNNATSELQHAIDLTVENISQSAIKISKWQEVVQQIDNPEIFAYWYNVRLKQTAFELQKYTIDLMIYDKTGTALSKLQNSTLPYTVDAGHITDLTFRIINDQEITYTIPIYDNANSENVIGYLSTHLRLLPLLKSLSPFQYIMIDSIQLNTARADKPVDTISIGYFDYELNKPKGITLLEEQIKDSILNLILLLIIPTILLYIALIIIIGIPIKEIEKYIQHLRTSAETKPTNKRINPFILRELNSVYNSLTQYHNELIQKETHLSLTLNSIGEAVITTDSDNNIVRMNPVSEKLTGVNASSVIGQNVSETFTILDKSTRKISESPFDKVIKSGELIHFNQDAILVSNDMSEHLIAYSAAPIRNSNLDILGIVLVFNDITEQKLKDEQLQQSVKMDALGKLTGGIAHDFNNILGIILGYSELLVANQQSLDAKALEYAEAIYSAGKRGQKLTSQLLAFSRKQPPVTSVCNINEIIDNEKHILEKTLTARINLSLMLTVDLWSTSLNKNLLQDAIINICINAMHAMPEGGQLRILTGNIKVDQSLSSQTGLNTGDYVKLSFIDNGCGMSHESQQKIFDPFFTTKGEKGTGLGMSQVYGFVQQTGGTILVDSTLGEGTCIDIYFPRFIEDTPLKASSETEMSNDTVNITGSETVLVVDDEVAMLSLTSNTLAKHGYDVIQSESAEQALHLMESHDVQLLLTDVIMPDVDGFQLATMVAKKYPHIKIQLVSGFSESKNLSDFQNRLYQQRIQKPFHSKELLTRIRQLLDQA